MARYIKFDFGDEYPILVRVEKDLTQQDYDSIESAIQSFIDHVDDQWDANELFVSTIMDSFRWDYEIIGIDKVLFI